MKRPKPLQWLSRWSFRRNLNWYLDRIRVLEAAVEIQRERAAKEGNPLMAVFPERVTIDVSDLLTRLHGEEIVNRDSYDANWALLDLQLQSLVVSGELGKSDSSVAYYINPSALNTLSTYQLERKKLARTIWPVWAVAFLTCAYVLFAALQYARGCS